MNEDFKQVTLNLDRAVPAEYDRLKDSDDNFDIRKYIEERGLKDLFDRFIDMVEYDTNYNIVLHKETKYIYGNEIMHLTLDIW